MSNVRRWRIRRRSEEVRVKCAYRDPAKIPLDRLVEMKRQLYMLSFTVESIDQMIEDHAREGDDGDDGGDDHQEEDNEVDDLGDAEEQPKENLADGNGHNSSNMKTPQNRNSSSQKNVRTCDINPPAIDQIAIGEVYTPHQFKGGHEAGSSMDQQTRWEAFLQMGGIYDDQMNEEECAKLLRNMELAGSDDELEEPQEMEEDQGSLYIAGWEEINKISRMTEKEPAQEKKKDAGNQMPKGNSILKRCTEIEDTKRAIANQKKIKWGPMEAQRRSTKNGNDTRSMLEKAVAQTQRKNLEIPKGTDLEEHKGGRARTPQDNQKLEDTLPRAAADTLGGWGGKIGEFGERATEDLLESHCY